jgi:hypothetical protein
MQDLKAANSALAKEVVRERAEHEQVQLCARLCLITSFLDHLPCLDHTMYVL